MKINVINNNVLNNLSTINQSYNRHKNTLIKSVILDNSKIKESPAVKISISLEGKQRYRDSLGDKIQSESYEGAVNQNELIRLEQLPKFMKPDFAYISEMNEKMRLMGGGRTTVEKASNLLKAYASIYDEIMQEKNSDNEDDISRQINVLNDAFKSYAVYLENAPKYNAWLEKHADNLEEIAKYAKDSAYFYDKASRARDAALRYKNDIVPDNLYEKIMTASKLFVEQYSMQKNGSMDKILEKIFPSAENKESM